MAVSGETDGAVEEYGRQFGGVGGFVGEREGEIDEGVAR